ncbi:YwmB family TATA-box binding protein [Halalkalibacter krulwichiae]|uniref:TATA-box binding protein n=1 Tax=Halalkalibacter krulwichiae TaxID=199441 RepID=A0A1X9MGY5_9BACI|nr:YwmB family TATA-box binding protein [Halalkalibacter krulwichiae]ARK32739.1 hypothetical protein BkAM31D_24355 [Halalkalibacter krulwichiae]
MVYVRLVVFGFVFSIIGYVHVLSATLQPSYEQPMQEFHELVEANEELSLKEWTVRLRQEQVDSSMKNKDDFIAFVSQLASDDWEESFVSTEGSEWKAHYTYVQPNGLIESLQFFAYPTPNNKALTYLVTYQVLGTNGSVIESNIVNELVELRTEQLSLQDATAYVQFQANDRSGSSDIKANAKKWIQQLGANEVEALIEEGFVSYSAFHSEWESHIETAGTKMNIQLAIRENERLGAGTTVTIGTPIITTEY